MHFLEKQLSSALSLLKSRFVFNILLSLLLLFTTNKTPQKLCHLQIP